MADNGSTARTSASGTSRLGIVVVNYASYELLEENLTAIDLDALNAMVVVVDSYSTSAERQVVMALSAAEGWALVSPDSNVGFGVGMNLGARFAIDAGCTHLLLLNPDVQIETAALKALVNEAESTPSAILSPVLLRPDGSTWFKGGHIDLRTGSTRTRIDSFGSGPGRWLTGACLVVGSELWTRLGGFDDRYFMYWEDIELSQRCLERGGELRVVDEVNAVHQVGGTQRSERPDDGDREEGQGSGSPPSAAKSNLYTYYVNRNRLLFAADHLSRKDQIRWLLHTPRSAVSVATRGGIRAAVTRPSFLFATFRGCTAGLMMVLRSLIRRK